ncbi:hypothetical protein ACX6FB_002563 [Vibrio cholerae]
MNKKELAEKIQNRHPNSVDGQQQDLKAKLAVAIAEDLEVALTSASQALDSLNTKIDKLESSFIESSKTSDKVAKSLNFLTGALVLVGIAQVLVSILGK